MPGLNEDQAATELRFRALRDTLGNFGRRRETERALIEALLFPSDNHKLVIPELRKLPVKAKKITLFKRDRTSRTVGRKEFKGEPPVLSNAGDIVIVQIADPDKLPIRIGLVRRVHGKAPSSGGGRP
jgi:hypothetical protein